MAVRMKDIQFPVSYATLYRSTIHPTKLSKRTPISRELRHIFFLYEIFRTRILRNAKIFNGFISIKMIFLQIHEYIFRIATFLILIRKHR